MTRTIHNNTVKDSPFAMQAFAFAAPADRAKQLQAAQLPADQLAKILYDTGIPTQGALAGPISRGFEIETHSSRALWAFYGPQANLLRKEYWRFATWKPPYSQYVRPAAQRKIQEVHTSEDLANVLQWHDINDRGRFLLKQDHESARGKCHSPVMLRRTDVPAILTKHPGFEKNIARTIELKTSSHCLLQSPQQLEEGLEMIYKHLTKNLAAHVHVVFRADQALTTPRHARALTHLLHTMSVLLAVNKSYDARDRMLTVDAYIKPLTASDLKVAEKILTGGRDLLKMRNIGVRGKGVTFPYKDRADPSAAQRYVGIELRSVKRQMRRSADNKISGASRTYAGYSQMLVDALATDAYVSAEASATPQFQLVSPDVLAFPASAEQMAAAFLQAFAEFKLQPRTANQPVTKGDLVETLGLEYLHGAAAAPAMRWERLHFLSDDERRSVVALRQTYLQRIAAWWPGPDPSPAALVAAVNGFMADLHGCIGKATRQYSKTLADYFHDKHLTKIAGALAYRDARQAAPALGYLAANGLDFYVQQWLQKFASCLDRDALLRAFANAVRHRHDGLACLLLGKALQSAGGDADSWRRYASLIRSFVQRLSAPPSDGLPQARQAISAIVRLALGTTAASKQEAPRKITEEQHERVRAAIAMFGELPQTLARLEGDAQTAPLQLALQNFARNVLTDHEIVQLFDDLWQHRCNPNRAPSAASAAT